MINDLWTVAQNVLTLFILIFVGACCQRTKVLNDGAVKCCANIALLFATPCIIIKSCARDFDPALLRDFMLVLLVCALNHAALIGVAHLLFRDKDEERRRIFRFAMIFSNAGYMAIPLQEAILGDDGVFFCAAYVIVFNIVVWTYGVADMSGTTDTLSFKRIVTNPGIIGVMIGLIVFISGLPIPGPVMDAIGHIGSLNTPLPMLIVGYYLAKTNIREALRDKRSYLCLAMRLVVMPLIALAILLACGIRGTLLTSLMICISTPVATACTMFATRYDRDPLLSVNLVSVSTLMSIVTMPLMIALTNYLGRIL